MVKLHESFSVSGQAKETTVNRETLTLCAVLALCFSVPLASAQAQSMTDPKSFAEVAASSNAFEIESSQMALDRTKADKVDPLPSI